jgi:hypothetical protein
MAAEFKPGEVVAIAFLAGFAIQQFLQILDLLISPYVIKGRDVVWSMPAADFKKCLMYLIAFGCGWLIASLLGIDLLSFAISEQTAWLGKVTADRLGYAITGFVLGSGTEAANTMIKYFGYLKDAQKYEVKPELEVLVIPTTATVKAGGKLQFQSLVKNGANQQVHWRVLQGDGGSIVNGLYSAPPTAGVYTVIAASDLDESVFATVKVTVT